MTELGDMNELVKFFEKEGLPSLAKTLQQVIDMRAESQPTERLKPPIPPKHPLVKAVETDGYYSVVPLEHPKCGDPKCHDSDCFTETFVDDILNAKDNIEHPTRKMRNE